MKFEDLIDFVNHRMSMSHIYQPLLIRSLVDAGGTATLRQLAHAFLAQDESQLMYYEDRIKEMPVKVLKKHGVLEREGELVTLATNRLTFEQKAELRMLCEQKLQEFIQKRGLGIWDYRMLDDPVPDSLRYRVLQGSDGRCALCGATKKDRPRDVDHIKPRSKGGKTVIENLQVLCSKCNRSKSNKDDSDFRVEHPSDNVPDCPFCDKRIEKRASDGLGTVFAIPDRHPVTEGHLLIIPRRHTPDFFSMTVQERSDATELIRILRNRIISEDETVSGFNVGVNCGAVAGQTINHAHIHLIPRRERDTSNPS